jgi:TPP-dependent pyruvate/acetoin dehydrogenase alpha subunit
VITDEQVEEIDQQVIAEVEDAAEFAENSAVPGPEEIYRNVYSDEYRGGADGRDAWR